AGFIERRIYVKVQEETPEGEIRVRSRPLDLHYVVLVRGEDCIPFCVRRRKGRLTFSDRREQQTGVAGTTGYWGNRTPQKPGGRRKSLSPSAWVAEVSRLIGTEQAREIVRQLGG